MRGMDFSISKGIDEIGEVAWNTLSAERPFQSYGWYRFAEKVMGASSHPTYVLLKRDSQILAGASLWRVPNEPLPFGAWTGRALEAILQRWPLLICRSPFSGTPGLIILPSSLRESALKEITRLGRRLRREEKASLLLFDGLDASTAPRLARRNFIFIWNSGHDPKYES